MSLKEKLSSIITPNTAITTVSLAVISIIFAAGTFFLRAADSYFSEASVQGEIMKFKHPQILYYSGKLENTSSVHAKNLHFKGLFKKGRVIDCKLQTMDKIESLNYGPTELAEFTLSHLSKKKKCYFDILVEPEGDINEIIDVSWGTKGGPLSIKPAYANEEAQRTFDKGADLSSTERLRWLQNNVKNIKKHKK